MSGTRRKAGRLGPYADGYRSRLLSLGYTPDSARNKLKAMGQLGRWMCTEGLDVSQLCATELEAFLATRRAEGCQEKLGKRSFVSLLHYLRDEQVIVVEQKTASSPLEGLLERYRDWLVRDRGLAPATVLRYETLARRFLGKRVSIRNPLGVEGLGGGDVTSFLLAESARLAVGSAKGRVAELRSLLRFLYVQGLTPLALAAAVPPVAGWRDAVLPVAVTPGDIELLLESCDRSKPMGIRDFAMIMMLARLGLRSAEVAHLELGDVDWRSGEILIRGKGRRLDRLPLPPEVGEALVAYLVDGRPSSDERRVFLTCRAPLRPIPPAVVGEVVGRACERVGVIPVGAHRLRHAVATEMLRRGAALAEISQVLRHQDVATTAIYAKVDVRALRQVARPWPGTDR